MKNCVKGKTTGVCPASAAALECAMIALFTCRGTGGGAKGLFAGECKQPFGITRQGRGAGCLFKRPALIKESCERHFP